MSNSDKSHPPRHASKRESVGRRSRNAEPPAAVAEPRRPARLVLALALTVVDLALIAVFVAWFYRPFMQPGIPPGDFASTVAISEVERDAVTSVFSLPTWNPRLMCGRPTIGYMSPFRILHLPFEHLDPIERMKALVILFNVLSGLSIYALVRGTGGGRAAGLFAGVVYPIMTSHVSRTGITGNVLVPMFFALAPLLLLALFRLRRGGLRGVVILALVLTACLIRDVQRTLLVVVMLGLILGGLAIPELWAYLRERLRWSQLRWSALLGALVVAFALAVCFDAFELINGHGGDPFLGSWRPGEQEESASTWAMTDVYTYLDRNASIGRYLEARHLDFYASTSRYLGLSLVAIVLVGALLGRGLGRHHRRFWLALLLLPVSTWLAFGSKPIGPQTWKRWSAMLASPDIPAMGKAAVVLAFVALAAALVAVVARNLAPGRRKAVVVPIVVAVAAAAFLLVAPLPVLQPVVFFLRRFRNPDWFQVSISSLAIAYPAALTVGVLVERFGRRWFTGVAYAALMALAIADFLPYRHYLADSQRSVEALDELRAGNSRIAEDPSPSRVLGAEDSDSLTDLGYVWHRKPLAWDFRSYTAPRRTLDFMWTVHDLIATVPDSPALGPMVGLAGVGYLVDNRTAAPNMVATDTLKPIVEGRRFAVFRNLAPAPFVRAIGEYNLLVGPESRDASALAGLHAPSGIALVHVTDAPPPELLDRCGLLYLAPKAPPVEAHGKTTVRIGVDPVTLPDHVAAPVDAKLDSSRPRPEEIVVRASVPSSTLVMVSESFHPWWSATIDGAPARIYPTGYAFLGVFVPEGSHVVDLRFRRPASYWAWGVVSLVSLLAAFVFLGWSFATGRWGGRDEALT